jgi:signal transduction histidine kinase
LTVIQGNLEGMLDGVYPLDRAHLEPVLDETRQLALLIEDLRTLALAESGALQLNKEPTDLAILLNETIASFRPQATASGITLRVDSALNLPNVVVDPARIRQVLENLIANALRYTPRGGEISVRCGLDRGKNVWIAVKDTGRGIPAADLPHIFERFYKESGSRGTGLGLAIASSVITAHDGEISAESVVDQGTTIRFQLPLKGSVL